MKTRIIVVFALMALLISTVAVGTACAAYDVGFVWNRGVDWKAGTVENATTGNPNTDSQGTPVWRYESLPITGGLSDPNPWYKGVGTLMNWNVGYQGEDEWAMGADDPNSGFTRSPFIDKAGMYWNTYHSSMFGASSAANTPAYTWTSPVSGKISISGTMQFQSYNYVSGTYTEWTPTWGQLTPDRTVTGVGGPAVIAKKSVADGTWTVLSSANIAFTSDGTNVDWNLTGMDNVDVVPGDQIRVTFMPSDWAEFDHGNWAGTNQISAGEKSGAPVNITYQARNYNVGHVWNRKTNYQAGTVENATTGNPNTDPSPVWRYEALPLAGTGGLSDPTPWFKGDGTLLNWNVGYQGGDEWALGADEPNSGFTRSPMINATYMYWNCFHSSMFGASSAAYAPSVSWISPVGGKVSISGAMQFQSYNYVNGSYTEWTPT